MVYFSTVFAKDPWLDLLGLARSAAQMAAGEPAANPALCRVRVPADVTVPGPAAVDRVGAFFLLLS
jgi:hypothetical protein